MTADLKGTIEAAEVCDNLPCPFCGGPVDPTGWLRNDGTQGPECDNCGATAPDIPTWNQRLK